MREGCLLVCLGEVVWERLGGWLGGWLGGSGLESCWGGEGGERGGVFWGGWFGEERERVFLERCFLGLVLGEERGEGGWEVVFWGEQSEEIEERCFAGLFWEVFRDREGVVLGGCEGE